MHAHILDDVMTSMPFDTLKFAKKAIKAGFTKEQAEFQASEMAKIFDENLATKSDFCDIAQNIKTEFTMLDVKLQSLENRLIIKVGSMLVVSIGALTAILKLFGST